MYKIFSSQRFVQIWVILGFLIVLWQVVLQWMQREELRQGQPVLVGVGQLLLLLSMNLYANKKGRLASLLGLFATISLLAAQGTSDVNANLFTYVFLLFFCIGIVSLTNYVHLKKATRNDYIVIAVLIVGIFLYLYSKGTIHFPMTTSGVIQVVNSVGIQLLAYYLLVRGIKRCWQWLLLYYLITLIVNILAMNEPTFQWTQSTMITMLLAILYFVISLKGFVVSRDRSRIKTEQ